MEQSSLGMIFMRTNEALLQAFTRRMFRHYSQGDDECI